jgi:hypothetical protein
MGAEAEVAGCGMEMCIVRVTLALCAIMLPAFSELVFDIQTEQVWRVASLVNHQRWSAHPVEP